MPKAGNDAFCQRPTVHKQKVVLMVAPPKWLSDFVGQVTTHLHDHDLLSPLGCHFQQVDNIWEITIFASRTEIVGGAQDGMMCHAGFNVDVKQIVELFATVESISWQSKSVGDFDELGSHISVEGVYQDQRVWLRVTAIAPERFEPGRRVLVNQQQIEEIW